MPMPESETDSKDFKIIFATAKGKVRKNSLEDFSSINASGKIAMKLDNNDKIVGVKICQDDQDVILSTKLGKCIRFESKKLRVFKGRSSKGIKGIELANNDEIVSLSVIDNHRIVNEGDEILISTNKGRVIRVAVKEIRTAGRNTQGVRIIKLSGDEKVVSSIKIDDNLI